MANGQFIIPGTLENEALLHTADSAFVPVESNEIDTVTQKRVDQIVDNYPLHAVNQALEAATKYTDRSGFDQILAEHPELYGLMFDVAEGIRLDAEFYRASAKPDILKTSLKERAFGIFLEKPELEVRLVNAESELGGKMFGNE